MQTDLIPSAVDLTLERLCSGRTLPNEKVNVLEERHKDLGLKDLGGTEISDRLFLISWRICGQEYVLLEEQNVVRDVLKFPNHSKASPQFYWFMSIRWA
jgi:hypothetical protein